MASIAGREGSQTRYLGGLPAPEAGDDLRDHLIELIGGGSRCHASGAGEAADKCGLFHGVPMVGCACPATALRRILDFPAARRNEMVYRLKNNFGSQGTAQPGRPDFSAGASAAWAASAEQRLP